MEKKMTCIICPRGCALTANVTDSGVTVTGNTCPKGEQYAVTECTAPVRTVTATVRVSNRENRMVSVKTETPVPKEKMMDVMTELRKITLEAPVAIGTVVLEDVFGSRIVTTGEVA